MIFLAVLFLLASVPLLVYRLVRGPHWTDRLMAADLLMLTFAAGLVLLMRESGWGWDRDSVWLLIVASFVGTFGVTLIVCILKEGPKHG